jgi:hypothetical protein
MREHHNGNTSLAASSFTSLPASRLARRSGRSTTAAVKRKLLKNPNKDLFVEIPAVNPLSALFAHGA